MSAIPSAPEDLAAGQSCDGGHCDLPSIGRRWFPDMELWLPCCSRHMAGRGVLPEHQAYDAPLGMVAYRLDIAELYAVLDVHRKIAELDWSDIPRVVGIGPSALSILANGSPPDADALVSIVMWLGLPLRRFACAAGGDENA